MKKFEIVAYSGIQYAPALCIWRETGEPDCIAYAPEGETVRIGYTDDAGYPANYPRMHRIYHSSRGAYANHGGRRYYLHDFLRV